VPFRMKFCPHDVGCCAHSEELPKVAGPLHEGGLLTCLERDGHSTILTEWSCPARKK
jgi:hypothetical protein